MVLLAFSLVMHAGDRHRPARAATGIPLRCHPLRPRSRPLLVALSLPAASSTRSATRGPGGARCGCSSACVVADIVIGLAYMSLARGLAGDYTLPAAALLGRLRTWSASPARSSSSPRLADRPLRLHDGGLGLFTLVVAALHVPAAGRAGQPAAAERTRPRIRELLDRYGEQDSLGYFALRNDKSIIWSPTGKSCIGYRVLSGVMLASGDPIGDPEAWPGAIHAFLDEAARHAWVPAVIGCSELGAEIWCREGEPDRAGARRRGDRQRGRLHPAGPVRCATSGRW